VFNKDENHLFGTFIAIPDYRVRPASMPIIMFGERPAGSPEAVRAWFYPARIMGMTSCIPSRKRSRLPRSIRHRWHRCPLNWLKIQRFLTLTMQQSHVVAMQTAPIKAQRPTEEEVEITEVFAVAPDPAPELSATLPETASNLPLTGICGLFRIAVGLCVRNIARQR